MKIMRNKLTLILIKQWFDMTIKGIKKEEYRDITPYWAKRLLCMENGDNLTICYNNTSINKICCVLLKYKLYGYNSIEDVFKTYCIRFKEFEATDFRNGYKPLTEAPRFTIENKGITIGKGNPDWGYVGSDNVFIIQHGNIIESFNIE